MLPQAESGKGRAAATPRSLLDTYSQTLGFTTGGQCLSAETCCCESQAVERPDAREATVAGQAAAASVPNVSSPILAIGADAQVDAAATVMRMLFIRDLRQLQTQVDDAIVAVQVFPQPGSWLLFLHIHGHWS